VEDLLAVSRDNKEAGTGRVLLDGGFTKVGVGLGMASGMFPN